MSQQSEMEDAAYSRLSRGPVSVASLVRELRERWGPEHGVAAVHGFVAEVGTCLLHRDDVELGEMKGREFVPWKLDPWDANHRLEEELMALECFHEDETKLIFRQKEPITSINDNSGVAPSRS